MAYRSDRTAEDIKREITVLIRELKDPRVNGVMLTVVRAEVAHDLSYCKAYVSAMGGIEEATAACKALNGNARGFIRKELGARIQMRKVPELRFVPDDSVEKGIELFRKLEEIKKGTDE